MIQVIGKHGSRPAALAVCDECGREQEVVCEYTRASGGRWIPNEAQIVKKLAGQGWSFIKKSLRCPECEAKRKPVKEATVTTTTEVIRQPTREQIREIIQMLEVAYDSKAGRYIGTETDATVAKSMGGGIMPGWVAVERERAFGPAGGNEELEILTREVDLRRASVKALESSIKGLEVKVAEELKGLDILVKRLEAIKKAVGPMAVSA